MPRIGVFVVFLCKFIALICLLPVGFAQATVYYVDQKNPAASDANPGTEVAPWLSLHASATVKLMPGDMVLVKEGIYRDSPDKDKQLATIKPNDSGKSGSPIVFKSSPRHAATITGSIQITNQSHIAIEGFRVVDPGKNGILIQGRRNNPVDGIAVRNNLIIYEQAAASVDFANGINVENAKNIIIDNNRIVASKKENRTKETTAINLRNVTNQLVEYNEIENMTNGISIRDNAINTIIGKNIISNTLQSIQASGDENTKIKNLKISNNIFNSAEVSISLLPYGGLIRKTSVNNNVFNNYSVAAMQIVQPGMGKIKIWNNVFKRGELQATFIADVFSYDDPPLSIARMDYNLFAEQPLFITGLYSTNRRLSGLDTWQEFAEQDRHSVVSTVKFRNPAKNDFRLAKKSRKAIKGRVSGEASSRSIEVGAYTGAIKQIGIIKPKAKTKHKYKQASSSNKPKAKTTSQASAPSTKKSKAKTTGKPKSAEKKKSEDKGTTQVAIVDTGKGKSSSKSKMSKLEWGVDRQIKFKGKCVLESNKIDFYDGHDNTGLKFRVLNNELYLLTKSNIDMSFRDVGLQVGENEFLHADNVVLDQNVVITKELPSLLTQLRKNSIARVQLRFWPSYPATKAYSEVVALDGFLPAYKAYKDCQQGD